MKRTILLSLCFIAACVNKHTGPENFTKVNEQLYFGGSPEENDFAFLKSQGLRSIICVDGLNPNLTTAGKYDLAYRHIPITYDKISPEQQKQLAKAYSELPKPIYIHCHHGRHRGPAAAAIVLKNHHDWKNTDLVEFMKNAGTSPQYRGLYKTVKESKEIPQDQWLHIEVPETAKVESLANTMAKLDRIWVKLEKQLLKPYTTLDSSLALDRSLLLKEYFVELERAPGSKFDEEYLEIIKKIDLLRTELKSGKDSLEAFKAVKKDCKSCHVDYRD